MVLVVEGSVGASIIAILWAHAPNVAVVSYDIYIYITSGHHMMLVGLHVV